MIYSFIKNNEQVFPIEKMCKVLQVSCGSYYRWKKQAITARQQLKITLKEQITLIYGNKLISKEQMKLKIFEYIEIWYNRKRRHSALNYATIEEFNNQINYKNVA